LISEPDTYFVGSGGRMRVYRVIFNDVENARYYFDSATSPLLARVDAKAPLAVRRPPPP
jgi:hypothetical protein